MARASAWILLAVGGALAGGCFHPRKAPCAFTCVSPGARCPADFTCGADGLCHRDGADGVCTLTPPEAGADDASGAPVDAGADTDPDGAVDAGATSDTGADPDGHPDAPG